MFSVFNAGFVEASSDTSTFEITGDTNLDNVDASSEYTALGTHPEDSDEEDEAYDPGEYDGDPPISDHEPEDVPRDFLEPGISVAAEEAEGGDDGGGEGEDEKPRNVRQKVAHPSSPRGANAQILPRSAATTIDRDIPGPPKLRVVVKDVAYATYRAVLYYVSLFSYFTWDFTHASPAVYGSNPICTVVVVLPFVVFAWDHLRAKPKRQSGQPCSCHAYRLGGNKCGRELEERMDTGLGPRKPWASCALLGESRVQTCR